MKKFLSLLALVLLAGTAQAQITALSELSNNKVYTVETYEGYQTRTGGTAPYDRSGWYVAADGTSLTTYRKAGVSYDATNTAFQFAILNDGTNYYLYSVAAGKFLLTGNELSASKADPVEIVGSTAYAGTFVFKFDESHYINANGSGIVEINTWNHHDGATAASSLSRATSTEPPHWPSSATSNL